MRSYNNSIKRVNPFILLNISIYILSAVCLMVYTTQQSYAHADDEDLGYDIKSANASVTVGTACTFTATVDSEHNATIANGIYSTDIGKTTLNTICNDSGGYAVYAIGYTGDEYGATDLSSDISSTYNISTGTNTSGDSSSWAMKLASEPGTTTATIENGYNNYNIVPDDYTKVASLNTVTDNASATSTTGSSISTTYQTYISPTQPAGTYTGKVKYTLVHPSTAPKPEKPMTIEQAYEKSGATKTAQGYYKMQDMSSIINDAANIVGDSLQVQDIRDNKVYWITKLADGNIWMTQNLDHDIVARRRYTSSDTDLPSGVVWVPTKSTDTEEGFWEGQEYKPDSLDLGDIYWNDNPDSTEQNGASATALHYHIGNYYDWTSAIAMNDSKAFNDQEAQQSICPANWRLPAYEGEKSYESLIRAQRLDQEGVIAHNGPTYFAYSGWAYDSVRSFGEMGFYWSNMPEGFYVFGAFFNIDGRVSGQDQKARHCGYSIRCVAR